MSIKCVISGVGGSHDTTVATAIKDNCSLVDAEIEQRGVEDFAVTVAYAESINAEMVVVSTTGIEGFISSAETVYTEIQCFVPLGINSYTEVTAVTSIPAIVTCGAGTASATANQTGHGAGLEFWDRETYGSPTGAESSYSNGVIAGKLYAIKTALNCSWWEARYRARITTGSTWNKYNGFGVIDVQKAIEDRRYVIDDAYIERTSAGQLMPKHFSPLRGIRMGSRYF